MQRFREVKELIKNKYLAFGLFVALFLGLSVFTDHRFSCSACGISHGGLHTVSQKEKVITMKQYKTGGHHLKKILCAILSAALISVSAVPAFAAETSDKSETAVTLKEGTYAPNQVVVKFKDSAIDTDTVPKKGEVEAVGADFGELADASSSKQEALGAADEEADILSKSLGGDFVLEDTLVFDTPACI